MSADRVPVVVPDLGELVDHVRVARWHKDLGDVVRAGECLLEIVTEKSDVIIESPVTGTVVERGGRVGETFRVGDTLAVVRRDGVP